MTPNKRSPASYSYGTAFLLFDSNDETIISRTVAGINAGELNPYEVNWMEVTLYHTPFIRDLLEQIQMQFIRDVAEAIDDEVMRHIKEDGPRSEVLSNSYGTGQVSANYFAYTRNNLEPDGIFSVAKTIAEGIAEKYQKKIQYERRMESLKRRKDPEEKRFIDLEVEQLRKEVSACHNEIAKHVREKNEISLECDRLKSEIIEKRDRFCEEIKKLRAKIRELQEQLENSDTVPIILDEDISIAEDRKVDVIKILHAMCNIGLFKKKDGRKINTKWVMAIFGRLLNNDFSKYSSNLSASKAKTQEASYMHVFNDLCKAANDYYKKD